MIDHAGDEDTVTITMTRAELTEAMREAVRAEFERVGLIVEEAEHVAEAREDFRFMRRLRTAIDRAGGIVGKVIVTAIAAGVLALIVKGFNVNMPR